VAHPLEVAVGQLAVIGPPGPCRTLAELLANDGERIMRDTSRPEALADVVSILTPREAKGLEFDVVVLLEPAEIVAASAHGTNDLYVAMTRPTQRLRVLHSLPLPAGLTQLETAG